MEQLELDVKAIIRDVPNFPVEGILFKDITTLLADPILNRRVQEAFNENARDWGADVIVGIDSRGFLFGNSIATSNKIPFVPVRKKGKLPYTTIEQHYDLEYGDAVLEIHSDAIKKGQKVLVHDDLLATGGTALAAAELIEALGGVVVGFSFVVNLSEIGGQEKLKVKSENLFSVVTY